MDEEKQKLESETIAGIEFPIPTPQVETPTENVGEFESVPNEKMEGEAKSAEGGSPDASLEASRGVKTFASDLANVVKEQKGAVFKEAVIEEKGKEGDIVEKKKNMTYLISSAILFVVGIALIIYFGFIQKQDNTVDIPTSQTQNQLIFADSNKEIDTTTLLPEKVFTLIKNEIKNSVLKVDDVENITLTEVKGGVKQTLTTALFLNLVKGTNPNNLSQYLNPKFMIGIHKLDDNQLFIIFKTNAYKEALSEMQNWENDMFDDLFNLFSVDISGENVKLFNKKFGDDIIKNKTARSLRDGNGSLVLMYMFPDENTIVITKSENALNEVLNRLYSKTIRL
ncbi:MAG: hypothetical protein WDK96_03010 [Candidatus Paceibacterota bacterium]|jgi:hypothetical protein